MSYKGFIAALVLLSVSATVHARELSIVNEENKVAERFIHNVNQEVAISQEWQRLLLDLDAKLGRPSLKDEYINSVIKGSREIQPEPVMQSLLQGHKDSQQASRNNPQLREFRELTEKLKALTDLLKISKNTLLDLPPSKDS